MNDRADCVCFICENKFISEGIIDKRFTEQEINKIINKKNLGGKQHLFFMKASWCIENNKTVSLKSAFEIARHWESMTKTFMFTTFRSLSKLAESLELCNNPSEDVLTAFQTGIHVISDDLNNNHSAFAEVAPCGPRGIHYKWWHNDIVKPLAQKLDINLTRNIPLSPNIDKLIQGMRQLANESFGFAVQLRIVEAIALHIAIAYRDIFSNLTFEDKKLFSNRKELAWITSHIKAEVTHHSQVSDNESGMVFVATTLNEQRQFLEMIEWYATLWENALNDFYQFLITI